MDEEHLLQEMDHRPPRRTPKKGMRGGRLTHFIHPSEEHYETRLTLQHPTLHLQATKVTTEDNTGKKNQHHESFSSGAANPRVSRRSASAVSSILYIWSSNCAGTIVSASAYECHTPKMNCKNNHELNMERLNMRKF